MIERVIVYIDGFNLYHGIKHSGLSLYLWLDIHLFSQNLLFHSDQQLEKVRYFTAVIFPDPNDQDKERRQKDFLKATTLHGNVCVCYGSHRKKKIRCTKCNSRFITTEEKRTDVNIAVKLLEDAQDNLYDTAFLVSGDEDLSSAVESINSRYSNKRVVVYFPPKRETRFSRLKKVTSHYRSVNRTILAKSQLPNPVTINNKLVWRPTSWR